MKYIICRTNGNETQWVVDVFLSKRERQQLLTYLSMAGLLSVFILALCIFILSFTQKTSALTESNIKRAELVKHLEKNLLNLGIKVTVDEKRGILRIPEDSLSFPVGSADVQDVDTVRKIGTVLLTTLEDKEYKGKVETVFIEGHTDDTPIETYRYPSNWELSTQRAINIWNTMKKNPNEKLSGLKNKIEFLDENMKKQVIEEPLFSCSGYAETRPIALNDTEEHKKANRRIDIRFTMAPPVEEDMWLTI
ncbi:MAG: OmpA family protein [Succiniclasticum sp.]|uniref:OmpA/MotB family protein n=1 Tax=Succiniclasticum sp. TaxID=2775030 RepID=UPI002A912AA1|nr:OmpA family protein [Succiniclasticum sp.]MDY6290462.1 OmpA family protein [Succiniclasticum sp.]